jgi:RimJ/RimL family protein N-acetyltransferase
MSDAPIVIQAFDGRPKSDFEPLFEDFRYGRYCGDWTLDIGQARRLELDQLYAHLQAHPEACRLALAEGRVVGAVSFMESTWDTAFWGIRFGNIERLAACGAPDIPRRFVLDGLVAEADRRAREQGMKFVAARADMLDLESIHALEARGFRYIETTVTNKIDLKPGAPLAAPGISIRPHRDADTDLLIDMTRNAFITHRFYADTRFPRDKVDAMYREWVRSSLQSPHWTTIVLETEGEPRGFFIYRVEDLKAYFGRTFVKWRLAAVAETDYGKGPGVQLFLGAIDYARGQADVIDSGLTSRNLRSFNLHNKLGFRLLCASVTLHRWYSDGTETA